MIDGSIKGKKELPVMVLIYRYELNQHVDK